MNIKSNVLQGNSRLRRAVEIVEAQASRLHHNKLQALMCLAAFTREGEERQTVCAMNTVYHTVQRHTHVYDNGLHPSIVGMFRYERRAVPWASVETWDELCAFADQNAHVHIWGLLKTGRWITGAIVVNLRRHCENRFKEVITHVNLSYATPPSIFADTPGLTPAQFMDEITAWVEAYGKEALTSVLDNLTTLAELKALREKRTRVLIVSFKGFTRLEELKDVPSFLENLLGCAVETCAIEERANVDNVVLGERLLIQKARWDAEMLVLRGPDSVLVRAQESAQRQMLGNVPLNLICLPTN